MGGRSPRRSSNVLLSESRRFCSAALCDVLRIWRGGPTTPADEDEGVAERCAGRVLPAT